jgi:hypothetical protein
MFTVWKIPFILVFRSPEGAMTVNASELGKHVSPPSTITVAEPAVAAAVKVVVVPDVPERVPPLPLTDHVLPSEVSLTCSPTPIVVRFVFDGEVATVCEVKVHFGGGGGGGGPQK